MNWKQRTFAYLQNVLIKREPSRVPEWWRAGEHLPHSPAFPWTWKPFHSTQTWIELKHKNAVYTTCVINGGAWNSVFAVVLLTGRTKALTMGLWTTWTVQETLDTSGMSLFLCARCCTNRSTTWWRTSVTGRSSSANSSMYWNTHTGVIIFYHHEWFCPPSFF